MGAESSQPEPPWWPPPDDTDPDPFRPREGQPPGEQRTPGRDWYPGTGWYPGTEYRPPQYGAPRYPRAPSPSGSFPPANGYLARGHPVNGHPPSRPDDDPKGRSPEKESRPRVREYQPKGLQYSSREQDYREPGDLYPVPGGHFILGLNPPAGRRPGGRHRVRNGMLVGLGLLIVIVGVGTGLAGAKLPSSLSRSRAASGTAGAAATPDSGSGRTLTYRVTGTPGAAVTYGPPGGPRTSRSPLHATTTLGRAPYYFITARPPARGSVMCEIIIGSTVISKSAASGRHGVASCQISRDPLSGQWQGAGGG
jgi:hypothetical protein